MLNPTLTAEVSFLLNHILIVLLLLNGYSLSNLRACNCEQVFIGLALDIIPNIFLCILADSLTQDLFAIFRKLGGPSVHLPIPLFIESTFDGFFLPSFWHFFGQIRISFFPKMSCCDGNEKPKKTMLYLHQRNTIN